MSTFELIVVIMLTITILSATVYFALYVKLKPKESPAINFPEALVLKVLQESPKEKGTPQMSAEDIAYLKEREKKAKEMTEEFVDMNTAANGVLDDLMGEKKK